MHRTGLNETALVSEMPIVLDKKKCYYATRARENTSIIVAMITLVKN